MPLGTGDSEDLLNSLGVPKLSAEAGRIVRGAGGNPLFLLETARHLLSSVDPRALPARMAVLLGQRLERLSPVALKLARAAAILGADFGPESAASMLGCDPLDLSAAWMELEAAQVLRGNAFIHDLLGEGVLAGLPAALGALLHRQAAAALESLAAPPARIAQHWETGDALVRSVPWWMRAARDAQGAFRHHDAVKLLLHAAEMAEKTADRVTALEAYRTIQGLLSKLDPGDHLELVHAKFQALAQTPEEQAEVQHFRAQRAVMRGQAEQAESAARQGLKDARTPALQAALLDDLAEALWAQNRIPEALSTLETLLPLAEELGEPVRLGTVHENIAVVLDSFDRHRESIVHHQKAAELSHEAGNRIGEIQILINLGISQAESGVMDPALLSLDAAVRLLAEVQGEDYYRFLAHATRTIVLTEFGRYAEAVDALTLAGQYLPSAGATPTMKAALHRYRMRLALIFGDLQAAGTELHALGVIQDLHPQQQANGLLLQAEFQMRRGRHVLGLLESAESLLGPEPRPIGLGSVWLVKAAALLGRDPVAALALAQGTSALARASDLPHLLLSAQVREAQALLALGEDALEPSAAAVQALRWTYPADLETTEVLWTHARVLTALGDGGAQVAWQAARDHVLKLAAEHVPPELRVSFLTSSPLNSAVLATSAPLDTVWHPLTDVQWNAVQHLLTAPGRGSGRPRHDSRAALDGVLWALATGAP
ncbi:hypothetical protein [Deinococcus sp. UYEF24]